ncbi:MAG: hypothetical protein AAGA65_28255 [Actinomycetota bacterium]
MLRNEIADSLALGITHIDGLPVRNDIIEILDRAVQVTGSPWRTGPSLAIVETSTGPAYVGHKGGCCLADTCVIDESAKPGPEADTEAGVQPETEVDDGYRAHLEHFPAGPDEPAYCDTCKFRSPEDSRARQLFWLERARSPVDPETLVETTPD